MRRPNGRPHFQHPFQVRTRYNESPDFAKVWLRSLQGRSQPSHIAVFDFSASSLSFSFAALSLLFRLISCSFTALSYALCSSVFLGVLTPSAPAISLPATAVDFSGLLLSSSPRSRYEAAGYAELGVSQDGKPDGEIGVGGGALGMEDLSAVDDFSISASEPERDSSSHDSATGAFDFAFCDI